VKVAGLTVEQAQKEIEKHLAKYVRGVQVRVRVVHAPAADEDAARKSDVIPAVNLVSTHGPGSANERPGEVLNLPVQSVPSAWRSLPGSVGEPTMVGRWRSLEREGEPLGEPMPVSRLRSVSSANAPPGGFSLPLWNPDDGPNPTAPAGTNR
jgi:hypothetical protein